MKGSEIHLNWHLHVKCTKIIAKEKICVCASN